MLVFGLVCSLLAIFILLFFLTGPSRQISDVQQLLTQITDRQVGLTRFAKLEIDIDDQELMRIIRRHRGLTQLTRDSVAILSFFEQSGIKEQDPEEYKANQERVSRIFLCNFGSPVDYLLHAALPSMPMGCLRLAAKEYFLLCVSLRTMLEEHRPDLLEMVATQR